MNSGQDARVDGSHNIIVQVAGDGIHVDIGRPHLTLIPPRNRVPRRITPTEVDLLNPYHRAIALVGREADLAALWDWLNSPRPIAVRTLTGRAGAGKTRAAIELVERLNTDKPGRWWAGFVQGRELRRFAEQQNLADWAWARPTLVVVDYAASLVAPLREWLRDLAQNAARTDGHPLRILLLEREATAGEGWLQSLCVGGYSEARLAELFDPLEPERLNRLDTTEKRREVLTRMLRAAAPLAKCNVPKLPASGQNPRFDRQLENAVWEDPLYLMMAALLSLRSDMAEVLDLPRTELALRLVDHEVKRLVEGVSSSAEQRLLVHLAAFAALSNGLSHEQAIEVAEAESAALKLTCREGPGALVRQLHDVLPAPDQGIASVVPDILAEALALRALGGCSAAQQQAAVKRAVKSMGGRTVAFILRTVQDFVPAGHTAPMQWLEGLIKAGMADDPGLLAEIESAMPEQTLVLREKAAEVNALLAGRLDNLARENATEPILSEQGRLLNNLANRLSALGRREEALAKAQEAVRIREQLAQARPDAFLPDLAMSCGARGAILATMDRHQDAAASFADGIRVLTPVFQRVPTAFAQLMGNLARNYLRSCEQTQQEPDGVLLTPVLELFEKLKQNRSKE
jgi:tetratricopeptide (TPR) repeat protein